MRRNAMRRDVTRCDARDMTLRDATRHDAMQRDGRDDVGPHSNDVSVEINSQVSDGADRCQ